MSEDRLDRRADPNHGKTRCALSQWSAGLGLKIPMNVQNLEGVAMRSYGVSVPVESEIEVCSSGGCLDTDDPPPECTPNACL